MTEVNPLQRFTILVIEDEKGIRDTLCENLELQGYRVMHASDGIEGLDKIRSKIPSLIITDVKMPHLSGSELIRILRKDNSLKHIPIIVVSGQITRDATRLCMELGADDYITKPFHKEEIFRSVTTRLEKQELVEELDSFARTTAHDLKTPLQVLSTRLELASISMGQNLDARQHIEAAQETLSHLNNTINAMLLLAGVRRKAVVSETLDMGKIVDDALEHLREHLQSCNTAVARPDVWPAAIGYAPWVLQVWINLLSNATKYGKSPVALGAETKELVVRFWVQDSGQGITLDAQRQLFEPFVGVTRKGSHGLGLSIVRKIVEKLGGQVGVTSELGKGATFWFELPNGK